MTKEHARKILQELWRGKRTDYESVEVKEAIDRAIRELGEITNKGEITMKDKIKQAVADEFKYRASQGRTNYSMEEVIYIVNEVIDEVTFEAE